MDRLKLLIDVSEVSVSEVNVSCLKTLNCLIEVCLSEVNLSEVLETPKNAKWVSEGKCESCGTP